MSNPASILRLAMVFAGLLWLIAVPATCAAGDPLADGLDELSQGHHERASTLLAEFVASTAAQPLDDTAAKNRARRGMIGAGQALRHLGRYAEAGEFFDSALRLCDPAAPSEPLWLAVAECAYLSGDHPRACEVCEEISQLSQDAAVRGSAERLWLRSKVAAGEVELAWQRFAQIVDSDTAEATEWASLAMDIGMAALSHNQPTVAMVAFRWYTEHAAPEAERESAVLGMAWAAAKGAESYGAAAQRLLDFTAEFPESSRIPKALLVCGGCFRRCDRPDRAAEVFRRLIDAHPDAPEAAAAMSEMLAAAPETALGAEDLKLLTRLLQDARPTAPLVSAAILTAAESDDLPLWKMAVAALLADASIQSSLEPILARLDRRGLRAHAERLATHVLGGSDAEVREPAIECTCRWAALRGQWSMLDHAARSERLAAAIVRMSPVSNRLLAEGLIQSGNLEAARPYLDHLIDAAGIRDFDVLLRRAEVAFAVEDKAAAQASILRASAAATSASDASLTAILQAQLCIRGARFDEARVTLEQTVRDTEAVGDVRARAQWLLGETHFLQRNYLLAIEAYRVVESLDSSGRWTAAALVQAGRAFEQLGRPRDAAICYTGLLRRFADSPHAEMARGRLASLSPSGDSGTGGELR